ncbi:MAG: DUF2007 domain-containing protein [Acidobacteriota bacterium]
MEPGEYDRLIKYYRSCLDEELLDFIRNKQEEFLPESLDLIRTELSSRGYKLEDMKPEVKPESEIKEHSPEGDLVEAGICDNYSVARQAVDILDQEGIASYISGMNSRRGAIMGVGFPEGEIIKIMVVEEDLPKAKEILSEFLPMFSEP